MKFKGKVAIVTGAGQGIGYGICLRLAEEGANVILNDMDPALAASAASNIAAKTEGRCTAFAGDAGNVACIQQIVDMAVDKFGSLDIAIANAGITLFGNFLTYQTEALYQVLQVNAGGAFLLAQAAANQMKKQASGGTLLFTSSVVGHQAHKDLAAYAMSKAAIEMLAKNLVVELSPFNINVNCIAPGATLTERTTNDASYAETWTKLTPLQRPASVADIAETALFLVSDNARHITGQSLVIDGGWTCVSPSP